MSNFKNILIQNKYIYNKSSFVPCTNCGLYEKRMYLTNIEKKISNKELLIVPTTYIYIE